VQGIGPALQNDVHRSAAGMSIGGVRLEAFRLHFRDGIHRRIVCDAAVTGGIGSTIDQQFIGAAGRSTHGEARWSGIVEGARKSRVVVRSNAESKLGQGQRGSARHGHVLDLARGDHLAAGSSGRLQHRSLARDRNRFRQLTDLHLDIESDSFVCPGLNTVSLQILIGSESDFTQVHNFSIVARRYGSQSAPLGMVGIIGPMRMEYARMAPLVDYLSRALSRKIEEEQEEG